MKKTLHIVLDTNIFISSLRGNIDSPSTEIIMLWEKGEFSILFSDDTLSEYIEKLSEKGMSEDKITRFIQNIHDLGKHIKIEFYHLYDYPKDQDDIAFVLCAENGKADYLVSYDDHLLILNGLYVFKICRPLDFLFEFRES